MFGRIVFANMFLKSFTTINRSNFLSLSLGWWQT